MAKDAARDDARETLAPGMLLAAPTLHDPNFEHSVVLLGRAGSDGALGWVINGRELMTVRELLASSELLPQGNAIPETPSFNAPVRLGGPVAPAAGWLVYRRGSEPMPGEMVVGPEIGVTGELAAFAALVRGEGPTAFKLLLGCAGWAPGQLEGEISGGSWLPTSVRTNLVLAASGAETWDEAYHETVGADPATFSSHRGRA
ncbi:MAG TPA: YqgE/AlgH family protein [Polyangia bacterium]